MDELNKMLEVDFYKSALNLLIDIKADVLVNRKLLIQVVAQLEDKDFNEIPDSTEKYRVVMRKAVIDSLPKIIAK